MGTAPKLIEIKVKRLGLILVVLLGAGSATKATAGLSDSLVAPHIVVHKRAHTMDVYDGDSLLRQLRVSLGRGGLGNKQRQGDGRVPEGNYVIDGSNPASAYHLSLHISYPSPQQVAAAAARGINPGGDIMIHGLPNGLPPTERNRNRGDWTDGCVAVTDREIEWLWETVPDGTPISIVP